MIKNYVQKMNFMIRRQRSVCGCCGELMRVVELDGAFTDNITGQPIDFAHNLSRTEHAKTKYKLFIDSTYNAAAAHRSCNTARKRLRFANGMQVDEPFYTDYQAEQWEKRIRESEHMQRIAEGIIC